MVPEKPVWSQFQKCPFIWKLIDSDTAKLHLFFVYFFLFFTLLSSHMNSFCPSTPQNVRCSWPPGRIFQMTMRHSSKSKTSTSTQVTGINMCHAWVNWVKAREGDGKEWNGGNETNNQRWDESKSSTLIWALNYFDCHTLSFKWTHCCVGVCLRKAVLIRWHVWE